MRLRRVLTEALSSGRTRPSARTAWLRPQRRRRPDVLWQPLAAAGAVIAVSLARRRLRLPRKLMVPVVSTVPLAVGAAIPRGRAQYALLWVSYVWVFKTAWEIPYDKPEKLRRRLHLEYPIRVDALLGGGVPPGVRLQRALRDPPRVSPLDAAATAGIYVLWLVPHAVLAWILLCDEQRFPRAAGRLSAVYHLTTLGYWLVPTAPPWWASEQEQTAMSGLIQHVTRDVELVVEQRLTRRPPPPADERREDDREGGNPWGSMPSDAFPAAVVTAKTLREISPKAGAAGWSVALAHGSALVYLGEHYVTDLLAGWLLVEVLWRAEPWMQPPVRLANIMLRSAERSVRRAGGAS